MCVSFNSSDSSMLYLKEFRRLKSNDEQNLRTSVETTEGERQVKRLEKNLLKLQSTIEITLIDFFCVFSLSLDYFYLHRH